MTEVLGSIIAGRYEVLRVHSGGMGVVSIVADRETGERYAAKSIREDLRADDRIRRRFAREVETWIGLGRHENVVSALFTLEDAGVLRLFLEAVDGTTLAGLLAAEGRLSLPVALDLAGQFARGLLHAHEGPSGGVLHRDVKPANLFVTRDRVGKVSDFGIARLRSAALEATAEGIGAGTPLYVSPEQLKGARLLDGRTDVYSFGAVLFEMLTGEAPLRAESLESQIYLVLRRDPDSPRERNPAVPPDLAELVLACLSKSPADRPDGFRPILRSLVRIRETLPDDVAASCPSCGFASSRPPGICPLCAGATGEPVPYRPRFADDSLKREQVMVPARLVVADVVVEPAVARVGEKITVRVALRNSGTVAARQVELPLLTPDRDVFPLLGPDDVWRGEVPPPAAGRTFDVSYAFVPLREGTYDMPPNVLRYHGPEEGVESVAVPGGHALTITRNLKLPLAGREKEWKRLTEHLRKEKTACVLVTSEGGGGRSRFVDEAGDWLTSHGRAVFKGKALERGGEPLKVFLDIARQIFGVGTAALGSRGMMARVIDRLAPLLGEDPALAGFFSSFLRGSRVPESQARMRGYLWFRLLSALASERPVVLLLTDLQWADGESIDLMEGLVRRAHEDRVPLSVIVSSLNTHHDERVRRRIAALSERIAALSAEPGLVSRVHLGALDVGAVRTLVGQMFPGSTLDDDYPWLVPILARQSGGNVFHLMQILRLLRESRDETGEPLVSAEEGNWTIRPELTEDLLTEMIPQATDGMVRAVIGTLPDQVRDVLVRAAFIGAEFDLDLLSAAMPGRGIPEGALAVLERADLVRVTDREGTRFRFTNSVVPAIVRRMESAAVRRNLNRDVARAMESTLTGRQLRRRAFTYARRLQFAGETEAAFDWYVTAARRYVREQLFLPARRALRGAASLLAQGVPPQAQVLGAYHYLRGEVERVTGDLTAALSAYDEAIGHLDGDQGRELRAAAFSRMGRIHEARGEPVRAVDCYRLAAKVRTEIGERAGLAHGENDLGSLEVLRGNEEEARTHFERAREIAEETDNRSALGKALDQLAGLALRSGAWEEAESLYRESLGLGERAHDRVGMAHSLNGLGGMAFRRGDLEEAARRFQEAMDLRREVGDREGVANLLSNLGVIHDRRGEYERALQYYRRATEAHRAIGSRRGLATVLNNMGVVNLNRGDVGIALERLEEALRIRREIGDRARIGSALTNYAEALALAGDPGAADVAYREAVELLRDAEEASGVKSALTGRARLLRRQGDLLRAEEVLAEAVAAEGRDPVVRAAFHLEAAEQHAVRGEPEGARRAAERGLLMAEEIGDLLARAQACRLLAGARSDDREEAIRLLEEAEELLAGTSGPELARVLLERGMLQLPHDPRAGRETLMRARGLLDAMEARGAVLPERECVVRILEAGVPVTGVN